MDPVQGRNLLAMIDLTDQISKEPRNEADNESQNNNEAGMDTKFSIGSSSISKQRITPHKVAIVTAHQKPIITSMMCNKKLRAEFGDDPLTLIFHFILNLADVLDKGG